MSLIRSFKASLPVDASHSDPIDRWHAAKVRPCPLPILLVFSLCSWPSARCCSHHVTCAPWTAGMSLDQAIGQGGLASVAFEPASQATLADRTTQLELEASRPLQDCFPPELTLGNSSTRTRIDRQNRPRSRSEGSSSRSPLRSVRSAAPTTSCSLTSPRLRPSSTLPRLRS